MFGILMLCFGGNKKRQMKVNSTALKTHQ